MDKKDASEVCRWQRENEKRKTPGFIKVDGFIEYGKKLVFIVIKFILAIGKNICQRKQFVWYHVSTIPLLVDMVDCYWTSQFYHKLVRSCSRIYAGSGVSQYPSQWTLQEDAWSSVTETSESTPEKIVDLYINDEERIVVFDSHSIDGGLFCLVSGEETEITNVLGIKGIMITETIDVDGEEPKMNVLAYYEDGYEDGIGMGGSYGACAMIKKSTYEENKELIIDLFKSIHIRQSENIL